MCRNGGVQVVRVFSNIMAESRVLSHTSFHFSLRNKTQWVLTCCDFMHSRGQSKEQNMKIWSALLMQNDFFLYVTSHKVQPLSYNRLKMAFRGLIQFWRACCALPENNVGSSLPSLKGILGKALQDELFDLRCTLKHISQLSCILQIWITWGFGHLRNSVCCL